MGKRRLSPSARGGCRGPTPEPPAGTSRTLVENKAGTVTLLAFDAGRGLSEHAAPFDALVQLDGEGRFTVGGKARCMRKGQVLIMPANIPHAVKASSRFKMLLTLLRAKG